MSPGIWTCAHGSNKNYRTKIITKLANARAEGVNAGGSASSAEAIDLEDVIFLGQLKAGMERHAQKE